jgi:hypothetical protein
MNSSVFYTNQTIDSDCNHKHTFCYLCSINAHEHEPTKPRDESLV